MSKLTRGPDGKPTLFTDLRREQFPVTITAFVGDEQIWERVIEPYVSTEIPPATKETSGKIRIHIRYATGEEAWEGPISEEEADAHIERRIEEGRR